jgi:hypothetical protein
MINYSPKSRGQGRLNTETIKFHFPRVEEKTGPAMRVFQAASAVFLIPGKRAAAVAGLGPYLVGSAGTYFRHNKAVIAV